MKWDSEKQNLEKLIFEDKLSYEAIGRMYGCSGANIKKQAKKLGLELPSKRKINPSETFNKGKIFKTPRHCINCGQELDYYQQKFCCQQCQLDFQYKNYINKWKEGTENGNLRDGSYSNYIRKYLFEKYNNKCQKCGWGEINPISGTVPLEIHHIDGDCTNNKEENLQLLCPTCHAMTENYGSRNKNATRKDNRKRYQLTVQHSGQCVCLPCKGRQFDSGHRLQMQRQLNG